MIALKKLILDLGFKEANDIFTGKQVFVLGEEDVDICGNTIRVPILYYNIENNTCKVVRSVFSSIQRECKSEEEIRKFVDSINFLFNLTLVLNNIKSYENVLSDVIKESYDKIVDNLEPPI